MIYNWILFNIIYIPTVLFFENILIREAAFNGSAQKWILLAIGQVGGWIYDKHTGNFPLFARTEIIEKIGGFETCNLQNYKNR